jgi:serine/threonine-protein kinase
MPPSEKYSANAPTLDARLATSEMSTPAAQRVAFVEGSTPELSSEIQALLRSRLRMAALLLALGFGVFFIRGAFLVDLSQTERVVMWCLNGGVAVILAVVGGSLCRRCPQSARKLRTMELVIFGLPAIYFLTGMILDLRAFHVAQITNEFHSSPMAFEQPPPESVDAETATPGDSRPARIAGQQRPSDSPSIPWMMLIFVYAMYIPNTWQRAAAVIIPLALMPVILVLGGILASAPLANIFTWDGLIGTALIMSLVAISSIWGVYTIHRLHHEAFTARQLGQYRLTKLLGAGGMGEVYLAEHQLMKRPCAIKIIRPGKAADPSALARFEREVRETAKLSHWNTVEIFDYGHTAEGTFYYVMEFLPGMSIADLVERHGPLPPERVVYLLEQTCEALAEAHALGLIHRDIKPGNLFAAQRGGHYDVAKLLDFGLAKRIWSSGESIELTGEGTITGSPLFMAPEQATGEGEPDIRSDIYALGAVAYYMLTGRPPFTADNPLKVMIAHATQQVVPPSQHRRDLPQDLEQVVLKCLAKNPVDRFQDTTELSAALAACDAHGRWTRDDARRWWSGIESRSAPNVVAAEAALV